jgi:hypothetical protein
MSSTGSTTIKHSTCLTLSTCVGRNALQPLPDATSFRVDAGVEQKHTTTSHTYTATELNDGLRHAIQRVVVGPQLLSDKSTFKQSNIEGLVVYKVTKVRRRNFFVQQDCTDSWTIHLLISCNFVPCLT